MSDDTDDPTPAMMKFHAVDLEQCALVVDSDPIARAMKHAATTFRALADAPPAARLDADRARADIGLLVAQIRAMEELTGEALEAEDAALITQIEADWNSDGADRSFQERVKPWLDHCFGPEIAADKVERSDRFAEEAMELVQAAGMTRDRAHALVDYVFNRPAGELRQEVGGVMNTLAALCLAHGLDMHWAGEVELARVWLKADAIREKQKAKPKGAALPVRANGLDAIAAERRRHVEREGWTPEHDDEHTAGQLSRAAATYAWSATHDLVDRGDGAPTIWPWERSWWRPKTRREDLVRAGALIAAEIDRLDRKTVRAEALDELVGEFGDA